MNKVALVTGASSLFGKQVAQKLKVSGFKVFAAAKQVDRVEDLKANGVIPLSMDLAKEGSIQQCVNQILSESGSIDVLVNNVSYGPLGAVEHFPMEEARRQFDINLFGTARVIQLVTPEMRFKRSGKIVNVSFMNGTVWTEMGVWYHSLKHAVDGFFDCLRLELESFGIDVMVIDPGDIKEEWEKILAGILAKAPITGPYARMSESVAERVKRFQSDRILSDPQLVAVTVCRAVTSRNPNDHYVVGKESQSSTWLSDILLGFLYSILEDSS